jgi:hypothetical protein
MKMMKWALLGGAAFAVMSTSAQADELEALKAQIEALQSRVTQLEAQPATSMPSGYSLLSMRDGGQAGIVAEPMRNRIDPNAGVTFSVLPAADVAPAAEISVSGEIRTLLVYDDQGFCDGSDFDLVGFPNEDGGFDEFFFDSCGNGDGHLDVQARGRLVVQGKVDTAVGEVGARIRLQGGDPFDAGTNNRTLMNQAYGWWKFAPNWQLVAGYWDTTAAVQAGVDWDFTVGKTGGMSDKNVEQLRLVYGTDGPFSVAIALEDTDQSFTDIKDDGSCDDVTLDGGTVVAQCFSFNQVDRGDIPAIAGYLMYNNDNLMFQLVGVWQKDEFGQEDDWGVGAGARVGLGDIFTLTAGGVYAQGYNGWANDFTIGQDDTFWAASVGVIVGLHEATRFELGGGYEQNDAEHKSFYPDIEVWTITGGIYWDPVSQVTLGLQANWQDYDYDFGHGDDFGLDDDNFQARFGTWLRFP